MRDLDKLFDTYGDFECHKIYKGAEPQKLLRWVVKHFCGRELAALGYTGEDD